jgi:hypothetical protein
MVKGRSTILTRSSVETVVFSTFMAHLGSVFAASGRAEHWYMGEISGWNVVLAGVALVALGVWGMSTLLRTAWLTRRRAGRVHLGLLVSGYACFTASPFIILHTDMPDVVWKTVVLLMPLLAIGFGLALRRLVGPLWSDHDRRLQ